MTEIYRGTYVTLSTLKKMTNAARDITPFLLVCLIAFTVFFSSYLRIPVMPLFAATLGAGPVQVGTINGAFMLTVALLSMPAGLLADRTGRNVPIVLGVAATAVSSLLVTLCTQPEQMVAAYIIFGVGLAAFAPAMLSLVADVIPSNLLGQAYGWYTTAIYIAMTLGPALGGYLAKVLGLRQVFLVSGGLLTAVTLLALLILPKGPPRHTTVLTLSLANSFSLLRIRSLLACLLATLASCIGFGVFLTFLPLYASQHGFDSAQVGLLFAAQAITNVVGRVPIGRLADRSERRWLVAVGLIFLASALIALGQVVLFSHLIICAVVMGVGMALTFTAIGALIAELTPAMQRGLAMGMYNSCIYLGMMFGSTVMGITLKQIGYPLGFALAGSTSVLAMVLFLWMMQEKKR
ncbi:MAG TPA: MFS transporter [Desulfuromonadales bacterium]|nr:MFS transporter [Desulfuromonadales bacterium]